MKFFRIRNFDKYQARKRHPSRRAWIKLHHSLFDSYEFDQLTDVNKIRLIKTFLLADKLNNKIPADLKYLSRALVPAYGPVKGRLSSSYLQIISHWIEYIQQDTEENAAPSREEKRRGTTSPDPPDLAGQLTLQEPPPRKEDNWEDVALLSSVYPAGRKARKQAGPTTQIVDLFVATYREHTGGLYVCSRPRMNKHISDLCKGVNWLWVREAVKPFFELIDEPPANGKGHTKWKGVSPSIESFCRHVHDIPNHFKFENRQEVR